MTLCVEHLTKTFRVHDHSSRSLKTFLHKRAPCKTITALDDLSFTLEPGQALCVLGDNGAGKSTLIKILSRIIAPTSGVCRYQGTLASLVEVGAGFHHELSVQDNIYLNGALLGLTRAQMAQRLDTILSFAHPLRSLHAPLRTLSTGMQSRLGLSIAIHADPDILLIDEALSVSDSSFQARCLEKLQIFRQQHKTLICIGHNAKIIEQLCDVGLYLDQGKCRFFGPLPQALEMYHDQTAR